MVKNIKWYSLIALLLAAFLVSCSVGQQGAVSQQNNGNTAASATHLLPTPVGSYVYPTAVPTDEITPAPIPTRVAGPSHVEPKSKLSKDLAQIVATSPPSTQIEFFIILTAQAVFNDDTSNLSNAEKGDYVLRKRQEVADRTQPAVAAALLALQKSGAVSKYEAISTPNSFYVVGIPQAVMALAERDDISFLEPNRTVHTFDGPPLNPTPTSQGFVRPPGSNPLSVLQWNIAAIHADQV